MLKQLRQHGEASCIEAASVGTSTLTVFLTALKSFCGDVVSVTSKSTTMDNRNLYVVVIEEGKYEGKRPTMLIDAGQEGGAETVKFALFIIEQLVACQENREMIRNVKWVIMPSTNPDGLEFSRYRNNDWRKNLKEDDEGVSFGVDISRNFDENWGACSRVLNGFAGDYPGPQPESEKETKFISDLILEHKDTAKIYLSLRRDGHHIGFSLASMANAASNKVNLEMIAGEVAHKVNLRSGSLHLFKNDSIFNLEGKARCGHSVDWAHNNGIELSFEMRVFLETDNHIMSMFQTLPRGYDSTLRNGYFSGIRELYSVFTNKKKYSNVTK